MIIPGSGSSSASLWVSGSAGLSSASIVVVSLTLSGSISLHLVLFFPLFAGTPLENGSISQLAVDQHEILMAEPCARTHDDERVSRKSLEAPKGFPFPFKMHVCCGKRESAAPPPTLQVQRESQWLQLHLICTLGGVPACLIESSSLYLVLFETNTE